MKQKEIDDEASAPYKKILLTFADRKDKIMMVFGYIFSIASGLGIPSFSYILGDVIRVFTTPGGDMIQRIIPIVVRFIIIGSGMFTTAYICYICLAIMSERIGRKTRVAYLRAVLRQEIQWFDNDVNYTELSSRLSRECLSIKNSLGEKMG